MGHPGGYDVAFAIRQVVGINLTALAKIVTSVWSFSLCSDGANHMEDGYLDIRLGFGLKGKLYNFLDMALPMGKQRHTAAEYFKVVTEFLKSLDNEPNEHLKKLMGSTSDEAAVMMGVNSGFNTKLKQAVQSHCGSDEVFLSFFGVAITN